MKLGVFAESVKGTVIGDPDTDITGVRGIADAQPGDITFISSPRYLKYLAATRASCVIVKEPLESRGIAQLVVSNPQFAYAKALEALYPERPRAVGISSDASVSVTARIGADVAIMPCSFIGDGAEIGDGTIVYPFVYVGEGTRIGSGCVLHAGVTVREGVTIGSRVVIHAGAVIGADGFGYVFEQGRHCKIPQVGGVTIGDDVEIGANVTIDRATTGETVIGKGTKIDNLVQIAHNVSIGEHCLIISQVGIAGSTEVGSYVTLAGQVGVADHATIESGTIVAAKGGVFGNLPKGIYSGSPVIPHRDWLRATSLFAKLPEMQRRIKTLEDRLETLTKEDVP